MSGTATFPLGPDIYLVEIKPRQTLAVLLPVNLELALGDRLCLLETDGLKPVF